MGFVKELKNHGPGVVAQSLLPGEVGELTRSRIEEMRAYRTKMGKTHKQIRDEAANLQFDSREGEGVE